MGVIDHAYEAKRRTGFVIEGPPGRTNRCGGSGRSIATISWRSEEHTSELQSLMRHSYAVFCVKKKTAAEIGSERRDPPEPDAKDESCHIELGADGDWGVDM